MPTKRKPRGAKGRMASPAQMARLREALGMNLTHPVSFEFYRYQMQALREESGVDIEKQLAAYAHRDKKYRESERGKQEQAWIRAFSETIHARAVQGRDGMVH